MPTTCSSCQEFITEGSQFCTKCGTALKISAVKSNSRYCVYAVCSTALLNTGGFFIGKMSYRDPKPYLPKCSYEDAIKFPYSGGISGTLLDVVPDVETGGNNSFVALVSRDQGGCVKIATNQGTRIYTGSGLIWPQDTADTKSDMATSRTKFDEAIEKLRGKRVVLTMIADSETGQSWLDGIGLYNSEAETLAVTLGALEHSSAAVSNASIAK